MGFKDVRKRLIEALRTRQYTNEERLNAASKNLLASGDVDDAFVIQLLLRCAAWEYGTSKHHFLEVDCHIFTPTLEGARWYIKAYLEPARAVFISVHP